MRTLSRPITGTPTWMLVVGGAAVIGLIVWIVIACSGPSSGTVYAKNYWPPYTTIESACSSYTDSGTCRSSYTYPLFHPEQFWLCLDNGEDRGCRPVGREAYNSVGVGDFFDHDAAVR